MRKKVSKKLTSSFVMISLFAAAVLAGCGNQNAGNTLESTPSQETAKSMKLTFALDQSPTDSWTKAARKFAELVKERSNNRIEISVHDSGTLGAQRQALEGILAGTIHGTVTLEPLSYWVEDVGLYGVPYLFRDQNHLDKFLAGEHGKELHQKMTEKGFRPITYFKRPSRNVTSNKPINNLEDMKGLKIRVPETPTAPAAFKAMGASPITMNFAELYSALETKVIDAQENPLPTIYANKIHEVQSHLAFTNHQYQVAYFVMSEKTYQELSVEDKKMFDEVAQEVMAFESAIIEEDMKKIETELKAAGVTFTYPDNKPFAEAAKGAYSGYTPLMQEWITKIQGIQ